MRRAVVLISLLLALVPLVAAQQATLSYFDDPRFVVREGARFPAAVDNGKTAAAFWQERRATDGWPQTFLSVTVRNQGETGWTTHRNVIGPFTLVGSEAQIYSALLTPAGVFWVAVLDESGRIQLFRSDDGAATFQRDGQLTSPATLLVPKLVLGRGDEPLVLVNQADATSFRIALSRRSGQGWGPLQVVTSEDEQRQSFAPALVRAGNKLVLVYQTLLTGRRITYQIYRKDSLDGGATWSAPVRLSGFADELSDQPDEVDNQRPAATWFQNRLFLAWERRSTQSLPALEVVSYDGDGKRLDNQLLTTGTFTARNPLFYTFRDRLRLAWFDNRNETYDVFLAAWDPRTGWDAAERLTRETGNTVFGQPAQIGDDLYFFWQNNFAETTGVVILEPDRRAEPPLLSAVNFKAGLRQNKPDFTVDVIFPRDVNGIAAFSTLLTQDEQAEPPHEKTYGAGQRRQTVTVPKEGRWFLAVAVVDGAGNWSPAARIPLDLKTTPPGPVIFETPPTDARGFLLSNTLRLTWRPSTGDAVAYSWRFQRVGDTLSQKLLASLAAPDPAPGPLGAVPQAEGTNFEDGLWLLSAAAFDDAGNRGPVSRLFFRLNKFIPSTLIQAVETEQDPFGRVQIVIRGRGFTAGGAIDHVYLDRDAREPFDLDLKAGSFRVESDQLIDGIRLENLAEGLYRVGVDHPVRGRVFTGPVLKVGPAGTVKIGDYRNLDQTVWDLFVGVSVFLSADAVLFWSVMLFLALGALASARLLASAWAERVQVARQASALFEYTSTGGARRLRRTSMKTKGLSLTFKFAASILGLTFTVILMLALTLGFFITENSQRTLGTALLQRTQVLLDSLATGARTNLPAENIAELGNLPPQISALEGDALYATITGPSFSTEKKAGLSFVWASNDPQLSAKIDTPDLKPGLSILKDSLEPVWLKLQADLNRQAEAAVGDLNRQIATLSEQARPLAAKTDDASRRSLKAFEDQTSALRRQVSAKLIEIGGRARSFPAFETNKLLSSPQKTYLFYQPFLYLVSGDPTYVRGLVRIEVSSATIEKQIVDSRNQLIQVTVLIALIALALGLVGAFILSALTINPIRQLVAGVEKIRDTDDKTQLDGHSIDVTTRDELEDLASTVNEMTHGLVKGAKQSKEMAGAKGLQKTFFIALDKDEKGNILTTFARDLEDLEVFAYYEGAKTVSGDLYEFRQLDSQRNPRSPWYGLMKGDISGKGVEALLSMTIAASYVTNFFRRWTEAKDGRATKIAEVLNVINDNLEPILTDASAQDGQQKFAALNIGILNAKTGELQFAQAGDNLLHLWRGDRPGSPAHFELVQLAKTAAAGLDDSKYHVEKYRNQKLQIESGDTLLYFTDGIEESQAFFRDEKWHPVAYFNPEDPSTLTTPGSRRRQPVFEGGPLRDVQATAYEDFGPARMEAIIEAYQHREVYTLVKQNWRHPDHEFHFDFTSCDGSAKGLVLALISIDRIFRLVPDPEATEFDVIDLDQAEDDFLRRHFVEFSRYFKDGRITYRQAVAGKENRDAEGYFLEGAVPVPVWQKGSRAKGQAVDAEGYLLVDGERVQAFERARKGEPADAEGYRLVDGQRVKLFEAGNPAKGDAVSPEGYKLTGGRRQEANPGYIRYSGLLEDPQFDDLTLLAIRRK